MTDFMTEFDHIQMNKSKYKIVYYINFFENSKFY